MLTRLTLTVAAGALVAAVAGAAIAQDKAPAHPTPAEHFAQMQKAQQARWEAYRKDLAAYHAARQEAVKKVQATMPRFGHDHTAATRDRMDAHHDAVMALQDLDADFMAKRMGMPTMTEQRARQEARMAAYKKESDARRAAMQARADAFRKDAKARAEQMREWAGKQDAHGVRWHAMPTREQMREEHEKMRAEHMKRMEEMRARHAPKTES